MRLRGRLALASSVPFIALVIAACGGDDPNVTEYVGADGAAPDSTSPIPGPEASSASDASADATNAPKVVHIATSAFSSCALFDDGHVKCWGSNAFGECATGSFSSMVLTPALVKGVDDAVAIGGGGNHFCVATKTGTAKCWGANYYGTLGNGAHADDGGANAAQPAPVTGVTTAAKVASTNGATTCVVLSDNPPAARCWGTDDFFQVGAASTDSCTGASGTTSCVIAPAGVQGGLNVDSIAGGSAHTCVAYGNSAVRCWGLNAGARLGQTGTDGDGATVTTVPVVVSGYAADELVAGKSHTCGRRGSGVACWGTRSFGATGVGLTDAGTTQGPTAVELPAPGAAKQLSARAFNTCALLTNGAVACWGSNSHGQLGSKTNVTAGCTTNGSPVADCRGTPELVGSLTDATEIAVGNEHACAMRKTGEVVCWGSNNAGQIGDGNFGISVDAPVAVHL